MPIGKQAAGTEPKTSQPVFVIGVLRSGTSLLYALLNLHPQVALMFECDVWDFPAAFSKVRFKRDWLNRQEFYNRALSRHRLIYGGSTNGLENVRTPEDLYRTYSDCKNKAYFGEKSPFYCTQLRQLARHYPKAGFILLWRDPVEIYRSVIRAQRKEPFFQRLGMLHRVIYHQEKMIQHAVGLERAGVRLCHVSYAELTADPGKACRAICQYLEIEYDEGMLDLANADLSSVHDGSAHNYLRSKIMRRQDFAGEKGIELIDESTLKKLRRFGARWRRMRSRWIGDEAGEYAGPEPSFIELLGSKITGGYFRALDDWKRVLFEFLPMPWLRTYRRTKRWYNERPAATSGERVTLGEQFSSHSVTILTSYLILAIVVAIDYITGPHVALTPFYLIPIAAMTLVINGWWGTLTAIISAAAWATTWAAQQPNLESDYGLVLWNCVMRFMVFEVVVLLLSRIRIETLKVDDSAD